MVFENVGRKVEESNPCGVETHSGFRDQLPAIQQHLPHGGYGWIRTSTERHLKPFPLPRLGYVAIGAPPGIRTQNLALLRRAPLPDWATGAKINCWENA